MVLPKLQVTDAKTPEWFFRIRYPGDRNASRVILGPQKEIPRKEAQKLLRRKYDEINELPAKKSDPSASPLSSRMKFSALVAVFMKEHTAEKSPATQSAYRFMLDAAAASFGDLRIDQVKLWHVQQYMKTMSDKSKAYRSLAKAALKTCFNYALAHEVLRSNPCQFAMLGDGGVTRVKRAITAEELKKIMAVLPDYARLLIRLGVSTGMRQSELLGLGWADVDLLSGEISCRRKWYRGQFGSTKTPAASKVYRAGKVLEDLRTWRATNPKAIWVFQSSWKEKPYSSSLTSAAFKNAAVKGGIYTEGFGYHSLRRAYISTLMSTATAEEIGTAVGKAASQLGTYTVLSREREEELVEFVQERFLQ